MANFKIGDQIVYIPNHAKNMFHPDAEFGFVTGFTISGNSAFCRYWIDREIPELRTTANSEATPMDMLKRCDLYPQPFVNQILYELGYNEKE